MEAAGGPSFLLGFFFSVPKPWVPRPCVFCKGGYDAADIIWFIMPSGLHRNAATTAAHHQAPAQDPRQRNLFADAAPRRLFWQARFYDFNVWTTKKHVEECEGD